MAAATAAGQNPHHLKRSHKARGSADDAGSSEPPPFFPLTASQAALQLQATQEYTQSLGVRLEEIFETHMSMARREEGFTQQGFTEAVRGLMSALSADDLYTAGVSDRPGAQRPQFIGERPWTRTFRVSDEYYVHMGAKASFSMRQDTTSRGGTYGQSVLVELLLTAGSDRFRSCEQDRMELRGEEEAEKARRAGGGVDAAEVADSRALERRACRLRRDRPEKLCVDLHPSPIDAAQVV